MSSISNGQRGFELTLEISSRFKRENGINCEYNTGALVWFCVCAVGYLEHKHKYSYSKSTLKVKDKDIQALLVL